MTLLRTLNYKEEGFVRKNNKIPKNILKIFGILFILSNLSFADMLKESWPVDVEAVREMAKNAEFGCDECLVVMTESTSVFIH